MKKYLSVFLLLASMLIAPMVQADPGMMGENYEQMEQYMEQMMGGELSGDAQKEMAQYMQDRGGWMMKDSNHAKSSMMSYHTGGGYWVHVLVMGVMCLLTLLLLIQGNIVLMMYLKKKKK